MKFWLSKLRHPDNSEARQLITLKDFLYLDFERVRSFVAQFYNGLPETRTINGRKAEDVAASLGIEVIAKTKAKVLTEKSISETQSLHLALYDIFEKEIIKQHFLQEQDLEGPLVKIKCQLRLIDYQEMSEKVSLFANLMPLISRLQSRDSQYTKSQRKEQQKSDKQQIEQFESMSKVIDMIFGSEIYTLGYIDGEVKFKTRLQKELLQFKGTGLIGSSEDLLTEEWTVVGMVIQKQAKPEDDNSTDPITQAIKDMNAAFDNMKQQLQVSGNNEFEIMPIAIYREIGAINGDKK